MGNTGELEVKAGPTPGSERAGLPGADRAVMTVWEEFKSANDERLDQIERRLSADVVTAEKVDRLNRALDQQKSALDELTLGARRPRLENDTRKPEGIEHKAAWDA